LDIPYKDPCLHEFVASASAWEKQGIRALDIAKALLDRGCHAPTIYFPLIVKECLMIEPTETENKATLDKFCADLMEILEQAEKHPEKLHITPVNLPVRRLDETRAAREMILTDDWQPCLTEE